MIPWFELRVIHLGPITIYVWGVFVALAILLGVVLAARFVRRRGLSADLIIDAAFWMVVGGLTGARLLHVFAYEPEYFLASPLEIFKVWHGGLSSFGGMIGGVLALLLFLRLRRMRLATFAPYLYAIFFALPFAWGFGRIGCFLTKMHPGIHNSVFFSVAYPDGPRLDMGLIEAVLLFALGGVFLLLRRLMGARLLDYWFAVIFLIYYGAMRLLLDFFRARDIMGADARYFGLTPGQYAGILMIVGGILLTRFWRRQNRAIK